MSDYQMFETIVRDVEQITAQVKRFTLVSPTGARCRDSAAVAILSSRCRMASSVTAMLIRS